MTPEQQRIAIAEACGWTRVKTVVAYIRSEPFDDWTGPDGYHHGITGPMISDYPNDLNAMHEAEKMLKWEQRKQYHDLLADIAGFSCCEADTQEETYLDWNCRICHATAAQRAEAFLKTLNLWTSV